jgi:N-acetylmuramoyl-L-alanine amidase
MTLLMLVALAGAPPPQTVRIVTPRGEVRIPVSHERGVAIAVPDVTAPLQLAVVVEGGRAIVVLDGAGFIFPLGSPFARVGKQVCDLVDESYIARDTLFLPLVWLTDCVPRVFGGRFQWDPSGGLLTETGPSPAVVSGDTGVPPFLDTVAVATVPAPAPDPAPPVTVHAVAARAPARTANPVTGLRLSHKVVIDPGHGGRDPGNPGRFFPRGVTEADVNLAIGKLLRAELQRRGIDASLTRSTDTLIDLHDRAGYCSDDCDLFVSIHVNSMPSGKRSLVANGVETYFLSEAKTEDQRRVARMENDAIRFESPDAQAVEGALATIVKDLQQNEYLRESARLADLVQQDVAGVSPGDNRGVQQAGFYVLNTARRPAILVETGFATNKTDGAFLASTTGQRKIAKAIADGIVAYLLEFEHKVAVGGGR